MKNYLLFTIRIANGSTSENTSDSYRALLLFNYYRSNARMKFRVLLRASCKHHDQK